VLAYTTAWAHEKSWINFTISGPEEFTNGKSELFRWKNGLYLQKELAQNVLSDFRYSNEQLLQDFEVDMNLYGKFDISGVKDGDPEPCPRTWDPKRQTWSDEWKNQLFDIELQRINARFEMMNYRLANKLPEPRTIMDICNFGIENPVLATNCIAEILEQLYYTDKYQTLITCDNLNTWYQPSGYPSFRYTNDRGLSGFIPPHDLAMCRLFMRFDGHFMRNGVKLFATSHQHQFNHIATPEMLHLFEGYCHRVDNLSLNDFRNAMHYYTLTGWMADSYDEEWRLENLFMETQGNWNAFRQ
jgi:small subunit ribosomal protein S29